MTTGRFLFKIIIFTIIVCYFSFFNNNANEAELSEKQIAHISTLLIQEQHIFKKLKLEHNQAIPVYAIEENEIPYIVGELLEITQLTEQIILATVKVIDTNRLKLEEGTTIKAAYTGSLADTLTPSLYKPYYWLIEKQEDKEPYYYVQGGIQGIIPY